MASKTSKATKEDPKKVAIERIEDDYEEAVTLSQDLVDQAILPLDFNQAATKCQHAFRVWRAKRMLKAKIRQNYVKVYDKINDEYLYKNRLTGEVYATKPVFLGKDDLPDPKLYAAPNNYDPEEFDEDAFALVVTVAEYDSDRMSDLSINCVKDHHALEDLLPHNFICKFSSENFLSLLNPTCAEFRDAIVRFRRITTKAGFLFVYICTHVVTVFGGEGKKSKYPNENAYLCMQDTAWRDAKKVAASSIPLSEFADMMNGIVCERKTFAFNYAHIPYAKPSVFGSKVMYPPGDFLIRLSNLTKGAVIGCCSHGTVKNELIRHNPILIERSLEIEAEAKILAKNDKAEYHDSSDEETEPLDVTHVVSMASYAKLFEELRIEWKLPPEKVITKSPFPTSPTPTHERLENGNYQVVMPTETMFKDHERAILMWKIKRTIAPPFNFIRETIKSINDTVSLAPRETSRDGLTYTLFFEAFKSALEGNVASRESNYCTAIKVFKYVLAFTKRKADEIEHKVYEKLCRQLVMEHNGEDFEGHEAAHTGAVDGKGDESTASAGDSTNAKVKAAKTSKKKKKKNKKKQELILPEPTKIAQTPVFILPSFDRDVVSEYPVSFRCGPPAQPEKPFVKKVGDTDVTLEWYNPTFDGIYPTHYEVYFQTSTRNYHKWSLFATSSPIKTTSYIVRDLPMGLPVKFRVVAYNSVGPSKPSEETIYVVPGESKAVPVSLYTKWHRLTYGGPLSVVDYMKEHLKDREEQIIGLSKLIAYGQREQGYPKGRTAMRVAEVCVSILDIFVNDPEVIAMAFETIGYSLCKIHSSHTIPVREYVLEKNVLDRVADAIELYRLNSRVLSSVTWLRSKLPYSTDRKVQRSLDVYSNSLIPLVENLPEDYFKQFEPEEENKESDSESSDEEVDGNDDEKKKVVQIVTSPFPDMY